MNSIIPLLGGDKGVGYFPPWRARPDFCRED